MAQIYLPWGDDAGRIVDFGHLNHIQQYSVLCGNAIFIAKDDRKITDLIGSLSRFNQCFILCSRGEFLTQAGVVFSLPAEYPFFVFKCPIG